MDNIAILKADRETLVAKKISLQVTLTAARGTESFFKLKDEMLVLDETIKSLNERISDASIQREKDLVKQMRQVLKETFGADFMEEIFLEADSRNLGIEPKIIKAPEKKAIKTIERDYRSEMIEFFEWALSARKAINKFIDENEPHINKAEYFQKVLPLTKSLPTIHEINRRKVKINF